MKITQDTVVTLRYQVTDAKGALIGGYDNVFPKVEAALDGQETGFQIRMALSPEDAFGERDESLVKTIPKTEFPPGVKVGGSLRGVTDDGEEHAFRVVKIKGPEVLLDGNHPLAGVALQFVATVTGVRAATAEEIAHRHVHGEHGHHH